MQQITAQMAEWDAMMDGIDKQQEKVVNEQWKLMKTQISSLMSTIADLQTQISEVKEPQSSLGERVQFLEDFIGESAEKHKNLEETESIPVDGTFEDHKTTMESRLEFLEALIGDSADKHANELASALDKMKDLHSAVESCAKAEHHSSMEQRVEYLEKAYKTTMESRLQTVEGLIGDSAEKHSKELTSVVDKMQDLQSAIESSTKGKIEQRMDHLEKTVGESVYKLDFRETALETRLQSIEGVIGDSAGKNAVQAVTDKIKEMNSLVNALTDHKESSLTRLGSIEALVGQTTDKHWKEIFGSKTRLDSIDKNLKALTNVDTRIAAIEEKLLQDVVNRLGTSENLYADISKRVVDALTVLSDWEPRVENFAGMEKKLEGLKDSLNKEAEVARAKVGDLQTKVSVLENGLDDVQRAVAEQQDGHGRKVSIIEASQTRFKALLEDLEASGRSEKAERETAEVKADQRISCLESMIQGNLGSCVKDVDAYKAKMADVAGKLEAQRVNLDTFRTAFDERLGQMDAAIAESFEDQKRSRDVLESSLADKIKLEHTSLHQQALQIKEFWDREAKARQAYQQSYQEMVGQERSSRESQESIMERRFKTFESNLYAEMQRIWIELGKEPPTTITLRQFVQSPRVSQRFVPSQPTAYVAPAGTISSMPPIGTVSEVSTCTLPPSSVKATLPSSSRFAAPSSVTVSAGPKPALPPTTTPYPVVGSSTMVNRQFSTGGLTSYSKSS
jgi:chromosome segregation ATPase